jgi:hypothetical protein
MTHDFRLGPYNLPRFGGIDPVDTFLAQMKKIPTIDTMKDLDIVVEGILVHWWVAHHEHLQQWG